ncbi:MAG: glycosyltransferase [Bacteroidales bacterium]|nr:glycosyltransferase [Bacteroidales bacterium]
MTDLAVIMSVYMNDRLSFVKESVESILSQTFLDYHLYIAFDGPVSLDIESYISNLKDERIRLYRIEKNRGLASALNYLLEMVIKNPEYKLIARMDADDISASSRFEKQRDFLLNNIDISCVGSWYEEINGEGMHLSFRKLPTAHEDLRKCYRARTPFAHPSVMYRRSLIEIAGFYPINTILMEDNVLWGRALKAGLKFANIPEYLLKFRIDEDFYMRRSGYKYGWHYIINRFKINKLLKLPLYVYIISFLIGIIKMMPSFILKWSIVARRFCESG